MTLHFPAHQPLSEACVRLLQRQGPGVEKLWGRIFPTKGREEAFFPFEAQELPCSGRFIGKW